MKIKPNEENKTPVISFRGAGLEYESLDGNAQILGTTRAKLAHRAFQLGFKIAVQEIAAEREEKLKYLRQRGFLAKSGGSTFDTLSALSATKARRFEKKWCAVEGLNLRPPQCQGE